MTSGPQRARRLRIIAITVLILGMGGGAAIYWHGARGSDMSDDPSMLGYEKSAARQIGTLYGNQGVLVAEWSDDLKQPGTQAVIILVSAAVAAGGCFYFARLLEHGD